MVGRAAHQAEGRLRPLLVKHPALPQVRMRARDLVGAVHRPAGACGDVKVISSRFPAPPRCRRAGPPSSAASRNALCLVTSFTFSPSTKTVRPSFSERRYSAPVRSDVAVSMSAHALDFTGARQGPALALLLQKCKLQYVGILDAVKRPCYEGPIGGRRF